MPRPKEGAPRAHMGMPRPADRHPRAHGHAATDRRARIGMPRPSTTRAWSCLDRAPRPHGHALTERRARMVMPRPTDRHTSQPSPPAHQPTRPPHACGAPRDRVCCVSQRHTGPGRVGEAHDRGHASPRPRARALGMSRPRECALGMSRPSATPHQAE